MEMTIQTLPAGDELDEEKPDYHSNVDTSRPFRSVKEAVAIFGERLLVGELYSSSSKPPNNHKSLQECYNNSPLWISATVTMPSPRVQYYLKSPMSTSSSSPKLKQPRKEEEHLANTMKKLEAELEETKTELKLLKERESETEVALASLNAELHKNMSKIAKAEATKARDMVARMEDRSSPTLGQVLMSDQGLVGEMRKKKTLKKKPIIPLVGDLLFASSKKKGKPKTPTSLLNPLYTSDSQVFWN